MCSPVGLALVRIGRNDVQDVVERRPGRRDQFRPDGALTDQQRFELDEKIKKNPSGFVYLDIEPNGPGGNFPIQGAIKLRSMFRFLTSLP